MVLAFLTLDYMPKFRRHPHRRHWIPRVRAVSIDGPSLLVATRWTVLR